MREEKSIQSDLNALTDEMTDYCNMHSLPLISADELVMEDIDPIHVAYLKGFILRWEALEAESSLNYSFKADEERRLKLQSERLEAASKKAQMLTDNSCLGHLALAASVPTIDTAIVHGDAEKTIMGLPDTDAIADLSIKVDRQKILFKKYADCIKHGIEVHAQDDRLPDSVSDWDLNMLADIGYYVGMPAIIDGVVYTFDICSCEWMPPEDSGLSPVKYDPSLGTPLRD